MITSLQECKKKLNTLEYNQTILGISKPLLKGDFMIRCLGSSSVHIENFKGINEYHSDFLQLTGKYHRLTVTGKNLCIDCYNNDEMIITGSIGSISFL